MGLEVADVDHHVIRAASCHYAYERSRDDLFAFPAMIDFIDSRYPFLPLPQVRSMVGTGRTSEISGRLDCASLAKVSGHL
jgi:hypothetical protein